MDRAEREKVKVPGDNYGRLYVELLESDLSAHAKLCYGVMWSFGAAGCWASLPTIARRMGVGETTVRSSQKELSDAGWIRVLRELPGRTKEWSMQSTPSPHEGVPPRHANPTPSPHEGVPPRHANPKQEGKQEGKQERPNAPSALGVVISPSAPAAKPKPKEHPGFDDFWLAWPKLRRQAKADALKAWNQDTPPLDAVLSALVWQRRQESWTKNFGAFIPLPATWLRGRRWEDEPPFDAPKPYRYPRPDEPLIRRASGAAATRFGAVDQSAKPEPPF